MHPLVPRILAHDVRAAARACRLSDDRVPGWLELMRDLFPHTGKAFVLGVTGNPGAGKSTVCDRLIEAYRAEGKRVAVVAVDPTSPFTGGAILGDRIRMQRHFEDPLVFIRSVATRGALGGLSRSAIDIVRVLDAWGADVILVETVGVGQDELEVVKAAHTLLVVMAPGMGDDVQAIKAGILECADVFAVNKADREGADATVRDLELMLALGGEVTRAGGHSRGHGAGQLDLAQQVVAHAAGRWVPPHREMRRDAQGRPRRPRRKDRHPPSVPGDGRRQGAPGRERARAARRVAAGRPARVRDRGARPRHRRGRRRRPPPRARPVHRERAAHRRLSRPLNDAAPGIA